MINHGAIASPYLNSSPIEDVFVRVQHIHSPDCFEIVSFQLKVLKAPELNLVSDIIQCSTPEVFNYQIDLNPKVIDILNGQSTTDFSVDFYLTESDALAHQNSLPIQFSTEQNPLHIFYSIRNIYDDTCFKHASFHFISFVQPEIIMTTNYVLCENGSVEINAPSGFDHYLWSTGDTSPTLVTNEPGTIELSVGYDYDDIICFNSIIINVILSEVPEIQKLHASDWSYDLNSVWADVTGNGNYSYSLDGIYFQSSSLFTNLTPGEYTLFVRDENGCGIAQQEFYLMMYKPFFTPNGDGYNDVWQLYASDKEPDVLIQIFDRYGKLLKTFHGGDSGWDGQFNGKPLPATDYWFVVYRSNGKIHKGHFALKR